MSRRIVALAVCCAFAMGALPAAAQQTTGTINGRILDEQGTAVPGVNVTATSTATGFTRSSTTD
jgi:hypothetical protein